MKLILLTIASSSLIFAPRNQQNFTARTKLINKHAPSSIDVQFESDRSSSMSINRSYVGLDDDPPSYKRIYKETRVRERGWFYCLLTPLRHIKNKF